jgi:hypothetical protein
LEEIRGIGGTVTSAVVNSRPRPPCIIAMELTLIDVPLPFRRDAVLHNHRGGRRHHDLLTIVAMNAINAYENMCLCRKAAISEQRLGLFEQQTQNEQWRKPDEQSQAIL